MQIKLYEQEGCFDLIHQENNPLINDSHVKGLLESEKSLANAWIEFDRKEYEEDPNFLVISFLDKKKYPREWVLKFGFIYIGAFLFY